MIVVFLIFAAVLVWFSFKSFIGGVTYLDFFRSELAKPLPEWAPFATVICPCRGIDPGMEENFARLLGQDYPDYELIFVVDDEADPAIDLITAIRDSKLVVAPKATVPNW